VRGLVCVALLAALGTAGCGTGGPSVAPSASASVSAGTQPSARPTFADVTTGDTESVVKLHAYDPAALSAVVEPIIFMQGPDFCAAFGLPESDERCMRAWTAEESNTKVTLPVSATATLLTTNGAVEQCMNWTLGVGTCAWSKAKLAEHTRNDPGTMVRLTTRAGTITRLAEIYTP
jgi:hypothetical protein